MATLTAAQQRWKAHLDAAAASGMPLATYARRHELNAQSLYAARQRIRKAEVQTGSSSFLRVEHSRVEHQAVAAPVMVRLPNGVSLQVACAASELPNLLRSLAAL